MKVVIVDYGMGNIYSIQSALKYLGYDSEYTDQPAKILRADKLILPGVGSYKKAMKRIVAKGLDDTLKEAIRGAGTPVLGICLGMQLLGKSSTEDGKTLGLGLFDGVVEMFDVPHDLKIPHIGYNEVQIQKETRLFRGLKSVSDFYFIHSFRMTANSMDVHSVCTYGEKFVAAFESDNIYGTHFHPEKSQSNGLFVLNNYLGV